jgi:putative hemolysin
MDQLGRIPEAAEYVEIEGYRIEVVDMDGNRIDKLLVQKIAEDTGDVDLPDEGTSQVS